MKINELKKEFSKNEIITDKYGNASVMVYIKKFYLDDVIDGASHIPHPAFIVDGKELDVGTKDDYLYVEIKGISLGSLDNDFKIAVCDGETTEYIKYNTFTIF